MRILFVVFILIFMGANTEVYGRSNTETFTYNTFQPPSLNSVGGIKRCIKELNEIANARSTFQRTVSDSYLDKLADTIHDSQIDKVVLEGLHPITAFMEALVDTKFEREAVTLYESYWVDPSLLKRLTGYSWGKTKAMDVDASVYERMEKVQKQFWAGQAIFFIGGFNDVNNALENLRVIANQPDGLNKKLGSDISPSDINVRSLKNFCNIGSLPSMTVKDLINHVHQAFLARSEEYADKQYQGLGYFRTQFLFAIERHLQVYMGRLFNKLSQNFVDDYFGPLVIDKPEIAGDSDGAAKG